MPWESVLPVSLEEGRGLKPLPGRVALSPARLAGGLQQAEGRQKAGSW